MYSLGGTTPKIDSQIGGSGLTSDNRAFLRNSAAQWWLYTSNRRAADRVSLSRPSRRTRQAIHLAAPRGSLFSLAALPQRIIGYQLVSVFPLVFAAVFAALDAQGWIQVPASKFFIRADGRSAPSKLSCAQQPALTSTRPEYVGRSRTLHTRWRRTSTSESACGSAMSGSKSEFDAGTCHHIAIDNVLYDNVTHQPAWRNLTDPPGDSCGLSRGHPTNFWGPMGAGRSQTSSPFYSRRPIRTWAQCLCGWMDRTVHIRSRSRQTAHRVPSTTWNSDAEWVRRREAQTLRLPCDPQGRCFAHRWRQLPQIRCIDQIAFCKE